MATHYPALHSLPRGRSATVRSGHAPRTLARPRENYPDNPRLLRVGYASQPLTLPWSALETNRLIPRGVGNCRRILNSKRPDPSRQGRRPASIPPSCFARTHAPTQLHGDRRNFAAGRSRCVRQAIERCKVLEYGFHAVAVFSAAAKDFYSVALKCRDAAAIDLPLWRKIVFVQHQHERQLPERRLDLALQFESDIKRVRTSTVRHKKIR